MSFLAYYRTLTHFDKFRCIIALVLMLSASICLTLSALEIYRTNHASVNRFGTAITQHTASSAVELLMTGDLAGMKLLVTQLAHNPMVINAAIYGVNGRILTQAGHTPKNIPQEFAFSAPIRYQKVTAGYVHIHFNQDIIRQPIWFSVQWLLIVYVLIMVIGIILTLYLGPALLLKKHTTSTQKDDPTATP